MRVDPNRPRRGRRPPRQVAPPRGARRDSTHSRLEALGVLAQRLRERLDRAARALRAGLKVDISARRAGDRRRGILAAPAGPKRGISAAPLGPRDGISAARPGPKSGISEPRDRVSGASAPQRLVSIVLRAGRRIVISAAEPLHMRRWAHTDFATQTVGRGSARAGADLCIMVTNSGDLPPIDIVGRTAIAIDIGESARGSRENTG
jgi:hypothetical protein